MSRLDTTLSRLEPQGYALLRVIAGFIFLFHGTQKLFGWLTTKTPPELFSQAWFGGVIETAGGLLLMVGLFTRVTAFISSGTMAVAYIQFHWKLAFADWQWLPIVNRGELAVILCFVFLFIVLRGPGPWSLDALRTRRRATP